MCANLLHARHVREYYIFRRPSSTFYFPTSNFQLLTCRFQNPYIYIYIYTMGESGRGAAQRGGGAGRGGAGRDVDGSVRRSDKCSSCPPEYRRQLSPTSLRKHEISWKPHEWFATRDLLAGRQPLVVPDCSLRDDSRSTFLAVQLSSSNSEYITSGSRRGGARRGGEAEQGWAEWSRFARRQPFILLSRDTSNKTCSRSIFGSTNKRNLILIDSETQRSVDVRLTSASSAE